MRIKLSDYIYTEIYNTSLPFIPGDKTSSCHPYPLFTVPTHLN